MTSWSLDTIDWDRFEASRVHPQLLAFARGACLVEYNADSYGDYLCRVFDDDHDLKSRLHDWAEEEKRHGLVLRKWVELADPDFDFDRSLSLFRGAYQPLPGEGNDSVRGSKARELMARCIVESGTSSFYSALKDAAEEPVLEEICRLIAQDEVRHFNLFRKALERKYGPRERLRLGSRIRVAIERALEASDEELSCAYRSGNFPDEPIREERLGEYSRDYMKRIARLYKPEHFRIGLGLAMRAAGIKTNPWLRSVSGFIAHRFLIYRYRAG